MQQSLTAAESPTMTKPFAARLLPSLSSIAAMLALAACGGSGDSGETPGDPSIDDAQRIEAANTTAQNNPACTDIRPFYWEIGDRSVALAAGSVGAAEPAATTTMRVASASKWIFGAYLVELRNGQLSDDDIAALNMRSGYNNLSYLSCLKLTRNAQDAETVSECFTATNSLLGGRNDEFDASAVGKFYYNGGHFQKHAAIDLGLGSANNAGLVTAIAAQLGEDVGVGYDSPQLAAGVSITPAGYALFLRKILDDQLRMHDLLGADAVCTNPSTCATALSTPLPQSESWHYSLGHWVEDDPAVGDGAYSSPGALGFYPWISASKTYYGLLAREVTPENTTEDSIAKDSVDCGRLIRKAWLGGTPVK